MRNSDWFGLMKRFDNLMRGSQKFWIIYVFQPR